MFRTCLDLANAFNLLFIEAAILSSCTYIFPFIANYIILLETQVQLAKYAVQQMRAPVHRYPGE